MSKLFMVGGCVRDKILGIDSKDIDYIFVSDNPKQTVDEGFNEMTNWLIESKFKIFLSTPDCFTIRAKFPNNHQHAGLVGDFVMARKEVGYIKHTRSPILEIGTIYDDLTRRDFTMNAIAVDSDNNIIDPFNGVEDIKNKVIKTPIEASKTMLDDPLRFLRALRFSITKGFNIDRDIIDAVTDNPLIMDKLKDVVSNERMREEIIKMMQFDTIASIQLIVEINDRIPNFLNIIFGKSGMWLKPTFEAKR